MSDEPRKRSRFDKTEPEPPKRSRFDRRSRSPARRDSEQARRSRSRSRSPASKGQSESAKAAKDAAAAAAARITASLVAKKGIQHVDVPPIRAVASPTQEESTTDENSKEVYQQDGDFIKDIEVNDLRNRYTLTKGSVQKQIKDDTGADVTTRGSYYPDKSMATATAPPLYLHVTSTSKEGLERAIARIEELMKHELPDLIDQRRFRRREPEVERDAQGRRKWPEESIPIDLEPIPGFNLRATVVGHSGTNVKHIQTETSCRVQIKGRGSGYMEHDTGQESDEAMYLHVAGPQQEMVDAAKELCVSLVANIKTRYEDFKEGRGQNQNYGGNERQHNDRGGYNDRGRDRHASGGNSAYGGNQQNQYGGNSQYGGNTQYGGSAQYGGSQPYGANAGYGSSYGGAQSPVEPAAAQASVPGAAGTMDAAQYQAWAAYYTANPAADPYGQYGGFAAYMQMYTQYQQQQQQQQPPPPQHLAAAQGYAGAPMQMNGGGMFAPNDSQAVIPPPPPPAGQGGYNAVPPPPGM